MKSRTVFILLFVLILTHAGPAQTATAGDPFASAASPSVRVAIWGEVNKPGQYSFASSPDLLEVISNAGGPAPGAALNRIILVREIDGTRQILNLNRLVLSNKRVFLATGDVVIIPESFWSKFKQGLPVITAAAAVANVAITAVLLSQR